MNLETIFKIIYTINILTFLFIIIEYFYSRYKKDDIHYLYGTFNNFINGLVMKYLLGSAASIYFFYLVSLSYNYTQIPQTKEMLLLQIISCLILYDFFNYLFHIAHHYFNFLWMFHHVHHSDKHFNLSTSHRFPFVEKLYNATPCLPLLLIGFNPYIVLLSFSIHSIYAFFGHSQYIKLPHFLTYIFTTPEIHKIHHDINHLNKNYGVMFTIWDRMFGTYVDKIDNFTPGIKGYHQDNFILMQTDPIVEYFKNKKWK